MDIIPFIVSNKENLKLQTQEIEAFEKGILEVESILKKHQIVFDEHFTLSFYNHVISMFKRIEAGELLPEMPEEMFAEISEKALEISKEIVMVSADKIKIKPNNDEVFLVSTHIQVAMSAEK